MEILDTRPAVTDPQGPADRSTGRPDGVIEMKDVTFGYPGTDRPALRGLSFSARPGELLVITDPSGAGKSTVSKLLLRFYDPYDWSASWAGPVG